MADPTNKQNRWWLLLLLLLLLWWWWGARRKKAAPAAITTGTTTTIAAEQPNGEDFAISIDPHVAAAVPRSPTTSVGGGGSFNGFSPGDVSDEAIARMSADTRAMLNGYRYQSDNPNDTTAGRPLLLTFQQALASGDTPRAEAARQQIADMLDPEKRRIAGLAAAGEAAARANKIASESVHTEPDFIAAPSIHTAPTYTPPDAMPTVDATAQALAIAEQLRQQMLALARKF